MAQVIVSQNVVLKITDEEWRLIMKTLAYFVGLKVTRRTDEIERAEALNKQLLEQRVSTLNDQLRTANLAL